MSEKGCVKEAEMKYLSKAPQMEDCGLRLQVINVNKLCWFCYLVRLTQRNAVSGSVGWDLIGARSESS